MSDMLQAACLVPLAVPVNCEGQQSIIGCVCDGSAAANALAECQDPQTDEYTTIQTHERVQPTPRQLQLLKSLGDNGITTSLCSPQFTDTARDDFGYRESAIALSRRLKRRLPD